MTIVFGAVFADIAENGPFRVVPFQDSQKAAPSCAAAGKAVLMAGCNIDKHELS